jgi:3-hydroxyisobutyrate dehydrogenase-like beta-hydroxyacid dehydrogenase
MGSAVGTALRAAGHRVVTSAAGRGSRTIERARRAGIVPLGSIEEAVAAADVVISVVPPASALSVAGDVRAASHAAPPEQIFLDANSVAPTTVRRIEQEFIETGVSVVDGAIYGSSSRLATNGAILVSGPDGARLVGLLGDALTVRLVGEQVGQASARKMLLAGLTKGLCALVLEIGAVADGIGELEAALGDYREFYPGIMELVDRMLPTYSSHAARRADELHELHKLAANSGVDARILQEAERLTRALSSGDAERGGALGRVMAAVASAP